MELSGEHECSHLGSYLQALTSRVIVAFLPNRRALLRVSIMIMIIEGSSKDQILFISFRNNKPFLLPNLVTSLRIILAVINLTRYIQKHHQNPRICNWQPGNCYQNATGRMSADITSSPARKVIASEQKVITLPGDILLQICEELATQLEFGVLFNCAVSGKELVASALQWLYRYEPRPSSNSPHQICR